MGPNLTATASNGLFLSTSQFSAPYAIGVCNHALTEGVWLRPLGNVLVIMPPLAISIDELDRICGAVERGIEEVTEEVRG